MPLAALPLDAPLDKAGIPMTPPWTIPLGNPLAEFCSTRYIFLTTHARCGRKMSLWSKIATDNCTDASSPDDNMSQTIKVGMRTITTMMTRMWMVMGVAMVTATV